MKKLVFIFLLIPFLLTAQRNISGKITDAEGKTPVAGASVFISNTTIGAFTDAEGRYQLSIPEGGSYRLTVSYVGYQTVFKDIEPGNTPVTFNATLVIQEKELEEVSVVAKTRVRQGDISLFWNTILGCNPSQRTIWVSNQDAVYFYYNPETRILKVTCREPLHIVNNETGYKINYVLNYFTHDYNKNTSNWSDQYVFTELQPENIRQENSWDKKRREVYDFSLTKFIKSLYNNSLQDDGFILASFRQSSDPNHPYKISLLNSESVVSTNSTDNSKTLSLSNQQLILICYGRSVNANDLNLIQQTQSKGFFNNSGLFINLLYGDYIRIFPDGTYAKELQMAPVNSSTTLLGLNMKLPFEYVPQKMESLVKEEKRTFDIDSINQHFDKQTNVFPQEKIHLHTDRTIYVPGERIWFKAYLTDAATFQSSAQSRYVYVELIDSRDSLIDRVMIRPDSDNLFYGNLFLSKVIPKGDYTLRAYTRYMENLGDDYFFKKNIRIESLTSDKQQLSITGTGSSGTVDIKQSQSNPRAYALTVTRQNNRLTVGVQKPVDSKNSFYLLGQCRGQAFYFSKLQGIAGQARNDSQFQEIAGNPESSSGRNGIEFEEKDLPAGVLQFVLFDEKMNPLSERLVFGKNQDRAKIEFHTDKALYNKREKVVATIFLSDSVGNPLAGNLSVAVTDDKDIAVDSTVTILSTLMLSSELKGYLENPAYYLQDNAESAITLDNLMLKQEWKRYNIPEVVKGNYESPQIPFQTSQEISGKVKSLNRSKPVSGSALSFIVKGGGYGLATTDKNGTFKFKDFEYPDSTTYFIQALGQKGNNRVKLVLDDELFPKPVHAPQSPFVAFPANKGEPDAFIAKAAQRSKYDEDMQAVQLNDVAVTGRKIENKEETRLKFWANVGSDATIRRKDIERMHPHVISDILRTIPGVRVAPNGVVTIRESMSITSGTVPLVLINGTEVGEADGTSNSPLEMIPVADVESIDVFIGPSTSAFGVRGANGVISVTTKEKINEIRKEKDVNEKETANDTVFTPLGYQEPAAFYSPSYENPDAKNATVPDCRTTIFWKPDVVVSNSGEASFEFYTSDFQTTYSVVIEGLTNDGKIVRQVEKIRVE